MGGKSVRPDTPVVVTAEDGNLTSVTVTGSDGSTIRGEMDADNRTWRSAAGLAGAVTYTVDAVATNGDGETATAHATFQTLKPKATTSATIMPGDGAVVGVGMPIVVNFGRSVKNKAAVVKALTVTATPPVEGAWRWMSDSQVQWRSASYWTPGTKVVVKAAMGSVEVAPGVWGKRTTTSTFSIGAAMISTVNMKKHTMTVTRNGAVLKVIPITTGKAGFLTRNGIKVIMSRTPTEEMDAATTGIPKDDPDYYRLVVNWAMRVTNTGEFLHAAPWSVGSQGRANVSHGCTGMSNANAKWMYDHSKVGDVVIYVGGSRSLEWGNGYTLWNKSFANWAAGR